MPARFVTVSATWRQRRRASFRFSPNCSRTRVSEGEAISRFHNVPSSKRRSRFWTFAFPLSLRCAASPAGSRASFAVTQADVTLRIYSNSALGLSGSTREADSSRLELLMSSARRCWQYFSANRTEQSPSAPSPMRTKRHRSRQHPHFPRLTRQAQAAQIGVTTPNVKMIRKVFRDARASVHSSDMPTFER